MRERAIQRKSLGSFSFFSLSLSLSLFSRVIGVRGPVVFVLGVPFPSLFCTFPEFSFNRGGARAVHARRSLRRLCPPRQFLESEGGGVSVSDGMAMFKLKPGQNNFKTDFFFFSIHPLISCGPISRASTDPVRVHESTRR